MTDMSVLQTSLVPAENAAFDDPGTHLRILDVVPEHHHDVVILEGNVLVYETDALDREGIQDRAFYVVEDQQPVGGMGWEIYDRSNVEYTRERQPRVRIQTRRRVVRAMRREQFPDHWWFVQSSGFHDGPLPDSCAAHTLVGKVVGIFIPSTVRSRS